MSLNHTRVGKLASNLLTSVAIVTAALSYSAHAELGYPEKEELTFGFIKLTDMAPIAVAYENGYFEDEGLYVTIEAQANWKVLLDGVIDGRLDGAHMLAGQPIAATIGYGTKAEIITPFSMDLNGNAITVSNDIWEEMKPNIPKMDDGRPVHPIKADVLLSVTPPPQMPATLEAGTIYGYCVGEPWNQQAVFKGIGVPVVTDYEIWKDNPEKVFGITKAFSEKYPNTTIRLTRALIRAAIWLDENNNANRKEAVKILAKSEYVGADYEVIANSMTGTFEYEKGDKRDVPDFNVFFRYNATYPYYSDAIWYLTQMRRWGQISEGKSDDWYLDVAKKVYRPDIYMKAVESLIAEDIVPAAMFTSLDGVTGFRAPQTHFIDNIVYDGTKPNEYIDKFAIGLKSQQQL